MSPGIFTLRSKLIDDRQGFKQKLVLQNDFYWSPGRVRGTRHIGHPCVPKKFAASRTQILALVTTLGRKPFQYFDLHSSAYLTFSLLTTIR